MSRASPARPRSPLWRQSSALLLALAAFAAPAPAAEHGTIERWLGRAEPGFQHLTVEQGMPNDIAIAVAQDGQGYMWIGTAGGLARWDGYRFQHFGFDKSVPGSLPDNLVQVVHADRAGRIWVGTSSGGLARYEPATQQFVRLGAGPQGLSHVSVRAIGDDDAGGLWVGTDGGLDHVDGQSGRVTHIALDAAPAAPEVVTAVLLDSRGHLWVGTKRGLFRRDAGSPHFVQVPLPAPATARHTQPLHQPESLVEDSTGRIWVGTNRTGALVIAPDGQGARAVVETTVPAGALPLAAMRVMAMVEAQPGEVWLATQGQGIVVVNVASGQTRRIRHRADMPASLADNAVRGLFRDRSGLLWAATNGGVSRVDPRDKAVLTIAGPHSSLRARTEYGALFTHSDGRLWMGTHADGLEIIEPHGGLTHTLRPDARTPDRALPPDVIVSMAEGSDGSVFVATYRGLYHVDRDGRSVRRVTWPGRRADASTGPLLRDGDTLWVAGSQDGLWQMDLASGRVQAAVTQAARTLTDSRVTALALGAGGEIWIGTRNGLNRFDRVSGQVQKLPADTLAAGFVTSLLLDRERRLWVGTYGGGAYRLDSSDTQALRWKHVGRSAGLPDENINAMAEDGEGRLWFSTEGGLAMVDPGTLQARALRRAEGVVYLTYWTNAVTRTAAGELLFGATGGLTMVRPQALPLWNYTPPVVVTELRLGGKAVPVPADGAALEVQPEANRIAVEYAALDYSAPQRNRYEHRLEGYEAEWVRDDPQRRLVSYANLPPGDYRLLLRGSNREGRFAETGLALPLRVLPAWHQTLAFRAAALAALALGIFATVHVRTRALRARRRELQRLVDERTAKLKAVSQALEEKSRVLEQASLIDPLTGLYNRRFLSGQIETSPVDSDTLFFLIDADHFKRINDQHGHAAGDAVLVQLAQRLKLAVRDSDFVVRWGGEEFLAVTRGTSRARADELAERIRASVAEQAFHLEDGQVLPVTCSVGYAAWPFLPAHPQAVDWLGVVTLADLGLLAAKRLGRNAWVGLQATATAQPEDLLTRARATLLHLMQTGEIALSSSKPIDEAAQVLAGLHLAPEGNPDRGAPSGEGTAQRA